MSAHPKVVEGIGLLDRALSELKVLALGELDEADSQTVKHHAEDCVGLGNRVLQILADKALLRNAPENSRRSVVRVGDQVIVYDRYRFAIPLTGELIELGGSFNSAKVRLTQSNNNAYPVGCEGWFHLEQLRRAA